MIKMSYKKAIKNIIEPMAAHAWLCSWEAWEMYDPYDSNRHQLLINSWESRLELIGAVRAITIIYNKSIKQVIADYERLDEYNEGFIQEDWF